MILPEYPKAGVTVGGRPVVASGAVVLGRHDNECSVFLDDLVFTFAFVPDAGALAADAQVVGGNQIRIRFTGTIGPLPVSYELGGVAVWNGYWLDLAVMIIGVDEGAVVRSISYAFTGGMRTEPGGG